MYFMLSPLPEGNLGGHKKPEKAFSSAHTNSKNSAMNQDLFTMTENSGTVTVMNFIGKR
jgi:hypothetical protein